MDWLGLWAMLEVAGTALGAWLGWVLVDLWRARK